MSSCQPACTTHSCINEKEENVKNMLFTILLATMCGCRGSEKKECREGYEWHYYDTVYTNTTQSNLIKCLTKTFPAGLCATQVWTEAHCKSSIFSEMVLINEQKIERVSEVGSPYPLTLDRAHYQTHTNSLDG